MLTITVPETELYDEKSSEFISLPSVTLELEHSLVALSKWESKYEKPFFAKDDKSSEEIHGYFEAMCVGPIPPRDIWHRLSPENSTAINEYLGAKMTATWFTEVGVPPKTSETVTSELIYYWMTALNIPFTCETWHLNRLFTLIRIANMKTAKPKKMSRAEVAQRNRELNAQRRKQLGTTG
jgi:hypothetical protein